MFPSRCIVGDVRPNWAQGIMINSSDPIYGLISGDVTHTSREWNPSHKLLQEQEQSMTIGSHDRLIIGWRINNC